MICVRKLSGRNPESMETNNEPYEPIDFYNPSIEDMLANPQVVVRKLNPIYGSEDEVPDSFSDDPQNIDPSEYCNDINPYESSTSAKKSTQSKTAGAKTPAAPAEPVPATESESHDEVPESSGSEE